MSNTPLDYLNQQESIAKTQAGFLTKVYGWMTTALLISGLTAMWVASTPEVASLIFGNKLLFYGLLIGELGMVWYLSARIHTMSVQGAMASFIAYSIMNGLTIAFIFFLYTTASIASVFFITAGTFGAMSAYGYFTKSDLSKWGNLLFMALIGIIIASIVNIFMKNETMYWIVTYAGVLIFCGLTAYDTQKLKTMSTQLQAGSESEQKGAILGALSLYLDFINLFIFLLRILGDRD